ncbi:metallophosphoesterase [Microbulbifer sp. THAF38]|uniref:metallophosphoesterase n=1 Tax=Microbulbifer sp. THAF38 TaxID=2587856 RepID=UPI0012A94807|nr:metallophosphoesterase [Microbulbifer sp. THAF38]QFT54800.1 putative metallophosphoesterase [Microbulbifer sp. THAF38]
MRKLLRKSRILFLLILMVGFILAVWAFFAEPRSFRINEQTLRLDTWPAACSDLRVAVLADLHVGSPYKGMDSLRSLVRKVNASRPDLVLLPGDFVIQGVLGGSFVTPERAAEVLAGLKAPLGVFAVLGNHDWWLDPGRVARAFSEQGIPVLEDASTKIATEDCAFRLVGISDFWEGPHNIDQAMAAVEENALVMAFTHNPDIFPQIPQSIALTIAGHTHGGQVYLPMIGRPIVPSRYGQRYAIGHIVEEGKYLYVSPGVGTSILPVRFLVPPEVTLLTLMSAE